MNRHPFLDVEYQSSIKLPASDERKLRQYLTIASHVFEELVHENVIKGKKRALKSYRVSLLLCGDGRIKKLNAQYRNKDKVTDVLSFPAQESLRVREPRENPVHLGDMAICLPQTKRQAAQYSITFWDEFIHLYFHGLLHLVGYDHEVSEKEEKLMEAWEGRALDLFSAKKKGA